MTRVKERVPLRAYRTIAELPACCASLLRLRVSGRVVGWFGRWGRGSATDCQGESRFVLAVHDRSLSVFLFPKTVTTCLLLL